MTVYYLQISYTVLCYSGNNAPVLEQMSNQGKTNEKKTKCLSMMSKRYGKRKPGEVESGFQHC